MTVSTAQAQELRSFNNGVLAGLSREFRGVERSLSGLSAERQRDALLDVAPGLVGKYGTASATGSAVWYERVRRSELGGTFSARQAAAPPSEVVRRNVRWAAGSLFLGTPDSAYDLLEGAMSRQVLGVSRETVSENVRRDPQAAGWQRIAQPDGCDFCVMLSQRGAVYKRGTADFASHDNCRCAALPSWDRSAPEVDVMAYEASQRTSGMSDAQKSAHNRRVRVWIDDAKWRYPGMFD